MTAVAAISQQIWDMKYRLKMLDGQPVDKTVGDTWTRVAKALAEVESEPCRMDRPIRRGAVRLPVPARRTHPRGRRHRAYRHPVQLLRHGDDPRRHGRHLRQPARSGPDHAAGRRHRLRLLHTSAEGRTRAGRRSRRFRSVVLHGRVGRHVPHHHERRPPPRRHDGDAALRPPRYRSLHRSQARSRAAAHVQPVGPGDRRLHDGGAPGRCMAAGLQRQRVQDCSGPRPVGPHHAGHICLCRTGRDLHRPDQPAEQPMVRGEYFCN